jgi:hypothetical protein
MPFVKSVYAAETASPRKNDSPRRHIAGIRAPERRDPMGRTPKEARLANLNAYVEVYPEFIEDVQKFMAKKKNGDETPWNECPWSYSVKDLTKVDKISARTCRLYIRHLQKRICECKAEIAKLNAEN